MSTMRGRLLQVLAAVIAASAMNGTLTMVYADVSVEDVRRAWNDRNAKGRKVRFEWIEKQTIMAKTQLGTATSPLVPSADVDIERHLSLSSDGEMVRFTTDGLAWHVPLQKFLQQKYVSVFNGKLGNNYYYFGSDKGQGKYPVGFINKEAAFLDTDNEHFLAVVANFRAPNPAGYGFAARRGTIEGTTCLILQPQEGFPQSSVVTEYWVHPERQFVIRC